MGRLPRKVLVNADKLREVYARTGSIHRTADELGHAFGTVRRLLVEAGIPLNPVGAPRIRLED